MQIFALFLFKQIQIFPKQFIKGKFRNMHIFYFMHILDTYIEVQVSETLILKNIVNFKFAYLHKYFMEVLHKFLILHFSAISKKAVLKARTCII